MEINHLLEIQDNQIITYDLDEIAEKVRWWLDTPQGEVWGDPSRGNKLIMFKHDPISVSTEIAIEAHILDKLPEDIPAIQIRGIRVEGLNAHEAILYVDTPQGLVKTTFNRSKNL